MRIINSNDIAEVVKGMCIKANCHINKDIKSALSNSVKTEKSDISKGVIENLLKNAEIADSKEVPICQIPVWQCSLSKSAMKFLLRVTQ